VEGLILQKGCRINEKYTNKNIVCIIYPENSTVTVCPFCRSNKFTVYNGPLADCYDCLVCSAKGVGDEGGEIEWRKKRKSLIQKLIDFFKIG